MKKSKTTLPVIVFALLLVGALLVWLASDFAATRRSGAVTNRVDSGEAERTDVELAASDTTSEEAATAARRALASDAPSETPGETEVAAALDVDVPSRLRIAIDDAWLTSRFHWSLSWTPADGASTSASTRQEHFELPGTPRSVDEFSDVRIMLLEAKVLALERIEPPASATDAIPTFELRVELASGAVVDWAPSVPLDERGPVDLALHGTFSPAMGEQMRFDAAGFVESRRGVQLPITLPRFTAPNSVWVGAAGHQWRAFAVEPGTERVDVVLARSAALIVRHQARPLLSTVVVQALTIGAESRALVMDDEPIEMHDLPAGGHLVWIEEGSGKKATHQAHVELVAGETAEVDLSPTAALDGLGGIRLMIRVTPEILALSPSQLEASVCRGTNAQPAPPVRPMEREVHEHGYQFEVRGLEPGIHTVRSAPFGGCVEVDVVAGEIASIELPLECVGFVRCEVPDQSEPNWLSLALAGRASGHASTTRTHLPDLGEDEAPRPVLCGTYVIEGTQRTNEATIGLVSDPFVVTANATTVVPLRVRPLSRIEVVTIDAATGAPIGFDFDFWLGTQLIDLATGAEIQGRSAWIGLGGAYSGTVWMIDPHEGRARLVVPDTQFWTFEPLDAVELTDGATITLRATAK
jgi:hypothetical protein